MCFLTFTLPIFSPSHQEGVTGAELSAGLSNPEPKLKSKKQSLRLDKQKSQVHFPKKSEILWTMLLLIFIQCVAAKPLNFNSIFVHALFIS